MEAWQRLTTWTRGQAFCVERVRMIEENVVIEGCFELPPLARLSAEDQVFVAAFIRSHGSIKQMEESYGLSYPTIKNRLRRVSDQLSFLDIVVQREEAAPKAPARLSHLLDELKSGNMSVSQILDNLGAADPAGLPPQMEGRNHA